jgi:hypothetical protein
MICVIPWKKPGIPEADSMPVSTPSAGAVEPTEVPDGAAIPPLENGDRLTRAEFERRYEVMPELKKAELIEGVVKGYIEGAPDLVAEVASTSASYDVGDKLQVYRRIGVREYVVWRVLDRKIDWHVLHEERYEPLNPAADGILQSTVFPGLWLDPNALMRGDVNAVFAVVQQGVRSPEHADFVAQLAQARIA